MFNDSEIIDARGKLLALDRSQAVIQFDLTGHVVEANENFLRLFEYERDQIMGCHHSLFCDKEYVASAEYAELWRNLASGKSDAGQYKRIARSGRPVWIQSSYNPILDLQGRPLKVIKFATDISEQKLAEQALAEAKQRADAALRSKEQFLSTMSHELRTPMNVIIGLGQLLLDDPHLSRDHREQIDDMVKAGGHLLSLINDVLDLTQVESGLTSLKSVHVRLDEVIQDSISMIKVLARSRQIQVLPFTPSAGVIRADPFRLKQVLVNLLSNAVKYNKANGSVRVIVSESGSSMRVAIEDTGLGIPKDKMDQLFQPFNRLGAEQTQVEGTGIGLSICKRMVEAMNGTICAESAEGAGSCFWIELPAVGPDIAHTQDSVDQPLGEVMVTQAAPHARPHILVAEDHVVNQKLIRRQLELIGYTCSVVSNGAEALEALSAHDYAMLLSDINMPVMDGYTLASTLRDRGYTPERLPIVFLTADVFNAGNDKWKTCGGNAYLTKPTQVDALAECLRQILAPR